ncbi:uncharacterized protein F4807DRAFT_101063 [Annulohypoxylon truncatum]|uniref:uncharacterized protein n=1 Tax=Annulohypoxylon truncatum TaxID=327061 RepID=UPI002007B500|nr:uncharacterized protein F4807DRAFT_101063 [Annulohypoxylon truncatum]KAI1209236.1 hypothetical protein F4807DRAFT_101063 [Annulohypoxylon truncatum]
MADYPASPLSTPSYNHSINNRVGLCNIKAFGITCDFVDSLCAYADVPGDTAAATPDLHFLHSSSIPTFRPDRPASNHQEPPVTASLVDGSSNSRNKGRQSQWQSSWRFIKKIDEYHQKLQECLQSRPGELGDWFKTYREPKDIRNYGLRALGDIQQNEVPTEFPEMLCAMIVQHAISHYATDRGSYEGVQSAFTSWRNTIPLNEINLESLNLVFEQLKLVDKSSLEDARPTRIPYETQVFETGRQFTNPSPTFYPQTINENSLSMWTFHDQSFTPRLSDEYPTAYQLNQPQQLNPFESLGNQYLMPSYVPTTNRNQSFLSHEIDASSTFSRQPHLHNPGPSFEYPQPPGCRPHETQLGLGALNQSAPFGVFKRFIDNFTNQGDLPHLFAQGLIRWNNLSLTSNARISEKLFFNRIENTLFGPLRNSISQSAQHPIAQAIVSTTWSVALLGALHSVKDTVKYMIHLSVSLFPNAGSCRDFVRTVLQVCPTAHVAEEPNGPSGRRRHITNHALEQKLDEVERDFSGEYHPTYLFASQSSHSRDSRTLQPNQPTIASQTSTSQPTLSVPDSTGSYTRSVYGTNSEISTPHELNASPMSPAPNMVRCNQCEKVFKGKNISSHLSRHKRSHVDVTIKCPNSDCNKTFKGGRTDNIRAHCRNVHNLTLPEDGRGFWAMLNTTAE